MIKCSKWSTLQLGSTVNAIFTESAPLGQFSLRVTCPSVCLSICALGCIFFRPLIGPEITWSVPRPLIGPPSFPPSLRDLETWNLKTLDPKGWGFFFPQWFGDLFFVLRGWVIFFRPERLGDLFLPERLGDFFLVPRGCKFPIPSFQDYKFPSSQVPKFQSSQVSMFPSFQVPKFPSYQVSKFPSSQVPKFLCPFVPVSLCPFVPLSLCPFVPLSLIECVGTKNWSKETNDANDANDAIWWYSWGGYSEIEALIGVWSGFQQWGSYITSWGGYMKTWAVILVWCGYIWFETVILTVFVLGQPLLGPANTQTGVNRISIINSLSVLDLLTKPLITLIKYTTSINLGCKWDADAYS